MQPLHDANGTVTGFTKIVRDSDDRHLAAESLRESEERLRLLIESVTDYAIFSIDPAGAIQLWNSGAERMFGYSESDVLGQHFSLIYTDDAVARRMPDAELAAAERQGHAAYEGWHMRRNGKLFYASGDVTRLRSDVDGKPRGFVVVAQDITVRNEVHESVKRQAFHDELTLLPNRAFFSDALRRAIASAKRHDENRFAVIFIDLDNFKVVNDSLGHVLADELLVHVARTLERCVRPEDVVARLGGDEFTILISQPAAADDAVLVAERVQAALQRPFHLDKVEVVTTASMGIAIGSSAYDKAEQILRDADTAMYEAKARGRSRYVLFDADMHSRAVDLLNLHMDLRRAIAREELDVEYQPIVSLASGRVTGFEALVRWNHPERGSIPPHEFIAAAETIGLIIGIDRWVLHRACRQLRVWQLQSGDSTLTVSVNLSSRQFSQDSLLAEIETALRQNGLTPKSLKLEITETLLMEQSETSLKTVDAIGKLGVELYIDDFGTGYSSLSYLTRFPLKLLKVDRSFVSDIASDVRSVVICRTVVALAHNLGLGALAEGIETAEQVTKLRDLGCEFGQGYWFSRPVAAAVAMGLIGQILPQATDLVAV